jgi:hypothetical protein
MKPIYCWNCGWTGDLDGDDYTVLGHVEDLEVRLEPGQDVPAGECSCGALVYLGTPDDKKKFKYVATYSHRHGVDLINFRSSKKIDDLDPTEVAKALGIEWEPEREERMEFFDATDDLGFPDIDPKEESCSEKACTSEPATTPGPTKS